MTSPNQTADEYDYIYVKHFRHKATGRIIYAAKYGKSAFRLKVKRKNNRQGRLNYN